MGMLKSMKRSKSKKSDYICKQISKEMYTQQISDESRDSQTWDAERFWRDSRSYSKRI